MITHLFVKELSTANEKINLNRLNKFAGAGLKKKETNKIIRICEGLVPFDTYPVFIFVICELRRANCDFDNAWTAVKPMLDGLQKTEPKIILGDSLTYVGSPAIIEYIKTNRKATHLILSSDFEQGVRFQKQMMKELNVKQSEKSLDKNQKDFAKQSQR